MLQRTLLFSIVLASLYVLTGGIGLSMASWGTQVTLLWAPTGLALGALTVGGLRLWPGVWLGALVVNVYNGSTPIEALIISVGNTLEAVVGATLLHRARVDPALERLRDVGWFLVLGVGAASTVAATIGTLALVFGGASIAESPLVWLLWWLGDSTGALVVAPVLLTWSATRPKAEQAGSIATVSALVLASAAGGFLTQGPHTLPLALVPFPVIFVASMRYGVAVSALLAGMAATLAVAGALLDTGPVDLAETWAYLVVLGSSSLTVAALVAERRAAQERQLQVETSALEAQRLEGLGLIAAGVAHDFNNLLQVILGHTALARDGEQAEVVESLDQIDEAVAHAARLVQQLLVYSGRAPIRTESLELQQELGAIADLVRVSVPATVTLSLELRPGIRVDCDRGQLHQVVVNLVTNASEAVSASAGRTVTIRCGAATLGPEQLAQAAVIGPETRPGEFGWLEVEDDGPGIPADTIDRLFEPFFTTRFMGRGLGLASVAGIARTHGGAIEVDSAPGRGTRMRVYLSARPGGS